MLPTMLKREEFLERRLRQKDIELRIYRELGGLVVKNHDLDVVFDHLMDYVLKAFDVDSGTLYLVDEVKKRLVFEVVKGPRAGKLKGSCMGIKQGIAGYVAATGKPYVASDLKRDKRWRSLGLKQSNMMAVPLLAKKKVMGVISIMDRRNGAGFGKDDVSALASIANHFSIIMERRELFSSLEDKITQFSVLNEVGLLLISTLDERLVRERVIDAITRLMDAETGSLLLIDRETNELYFEVALGERGEEVKTVRLKIGEGIAGWVAKYGRPALVGDVTKDRRFQPRVDKRSRFATRSILCAPVKVKGATIGVIQAINKKQGSFTKEDQGLFEIFSNQVAIALDNARLYREIRDTFYSTSHALADAIEKRDPYTGGHTKRVLEYSLAIGKELGMNKEELENLKFAAVLHDIGKIGIDDAVLRKEARLDKEELEVMMRHPDIGAQILSRIPQLASIMPGILHHHERVDGKGYPAGFQNGDIPLIARIIAVADTYDAMTTTRPYRQGLPADTAIDELKRFSGMQFDKDVVHAFIRAFERGGIRIDREGPKR